MKFLIAIVLSTFAVFIQSGSSLPATWNLTEVKKPSNDVPQVVGEKTQNEPPSPQQGVTSPAGTGDSSPSRARDEDNKDLSKSLYVTSPPKERDVAPPYSKGSVPPPSSETGVVPSSLERDGPPPTKKEDVSASNPEGKDVDNPPEPENVTSSSKQGDVPPPSSGENVKTASARARVVPPSPSKNGAILPSPKKGDDFPVDTEDGDITDPCAPEDVPSPYRVDVPPKSSVQNVPQTSTKARVVRQSPPKAEVVQTSPEKYLSPTDPETSYRGNLFKPKYVPSLYE